MKFVDAPLAGLKDAANVFKERVNGVDVVVGALAGMVAGGLFKGFLKSGKVSNATLLKVEPYSAELGSLAAGLLLFAAQNGRGRAPGHLVGAVASAVVPYVSNKVGDVAAKSLGVQFNGYVLAPLNGYGMIVPDASYGMIVPDASYGLAPNDDSPSEYQMASLSAYSEAIGEEESDYVV